jgi:hypothetical protein
VHCREGKSRSPTIVIAYVMKVQLPSSLPLLPVLFLASFLLLLWLTTKCSIVKRNWPRRTKTYLPKMETCASTTGSKRSSWNSKIRFSRAIRSISSPKKAGSTDLRKWKWRRKSRRRNRIRTHSWARMTN